ncbi:hypothetical protein TrVE_jg12684 [Triparma verrucosa]|uniref:Uncharacterized protein n=1 Tax=Triparma verrucosa TaxID=1606542 RepID=A0A9W7C153_9STRA|nr:hypothetical protein TrVE_jg12684 [Triparma verrucosa]
MPVPAWTTSPAMSGQILNPSVSKVGSVTFLLGGFTGQDEMDLAASCLKDEGDSGDWCYVEMSGDVPSSRTLLSTAGVDDKIYVFGGESLETGEVLGDLYEGLVVGSCIEWTKRTTDDVIVETKPSPSNTGGEGGEGDAPVAAAPVRKGKPAWPAARKGHGGCLAVSKGASKMFMCGGNVGSGHSWLFDPTTRSWSDGKTSGKSPFPLTKFSLVGSGDGTYAALTGGISASGSVSSAISIIDFETMAWSSVKGGLSSSVHGHVSCWLLNPNGVALGAGVSAASLAPSETSKEGEEGEPVAPPVAKKDKGLWRSGEEGNEWCLVVFGGVGQARAGEVNIVDRGGAVEKVAVEGECGEAGRWGSGVGVANGGRDCIVVGGSLKGSRFSDAFRLSLWNPDPPKVVEEEEEEKREAGYEEMEFPDGFYKGIVVEGARSGAGMQTFTNGNVYEGEWENDTMNGAGVMAFNDGGRYDGGWENGRRSGEGKMDWPEGREGDAITTLVQYEGMWEQDEPHGDGVGLFADGYQYEGNFVSGLPQGRGALFYPEGGECEGLFQEGQCISGKEIDKDGVSYEGKFSKGLRAVKKGDGLMVGIDGSTYEGGFRSGRKNGFGTYVDGKTGCTYVGKWVGGMRNGNGTETSASGAKWVGTWKDDLKHGNGVFTKADNAGVVCGVWIEGELEQVEVGGGGEGEENEEKKE